MSQALQDLGGAPASAPLLTLSQSRALAALLDQARRVASITGQDVRGVLLNRPVRAHETTMRALTQLGLLTEVRCLPTHRGHRPDLRLRWRLTAAGLRVATSPCPAAEAATGGRA
jgi:hypothetical protein